MQKKLPILIFLLIFVVTSTISYTAQITVDNVNIDIIDASDRDKFVDATIIFNGETKKTNKNEGLKYNYINRVMFDNVPVDVELPIIVEAEGYKTVETTFKITTPYSSVSNGTHIYLQPKTAEDLDEENKNSSISDYLQYTKIHVLDSNNIDKVITASIAFNGQTKITEKTFKSNNEATFENVPKNVRLPITIIADGYKTVNAWIKYLPISETLEYRLVYLQPINQPANVVVRNIYEEVNIIENMTTASSWAMPEIKKANESGLLTNKLNKGNYKDNATREQFSEIVNRLHLSLGGLMAENYLFLKDYDIDVGDSGILNAFYTGLISGKGNKILDPDGQLTREQLCTMIIGALDMAGVEYDKSIQFQKSYKDKNKISSWAYDSVRILNGYKILNGYNDQLNPKGVVTKEMAILLAYRVFEMFR